MATTTRRRAEAKTIPELLAFVAEDFASGAGYLRIMSLRRPEREMIALNRLAARIEKFGAGLGRMLEDEKEEELTQRGK